ncbi:MAG: radical SAM protein [Candidatus Sabulitectum sp.]|nr:radical SAM protein [Candidatus Sabulitectum sp.]
MNLVKMAASYLNPAQPSFLILFVTSRCNARCSFCFYADELNKDKDSVSELTTDEMERISKKCGNIPYLLLSGGEPVLRNDLEEVVGFFIKNANSQFITIPSNGLSPDRSEKLFANLTEKYPGCHFRAAFSVDFSNKKHDDIRGVPGCLDSILETTERINTLKQSRNNLTLDILTVYLQENASVHSELREWVREKINPDNHELHLLRPDWPNVTVDGLNTDQFLEEIMVYRKASTSKETRFLSPFFRGLNSVYIQNLRRIMNGEHISRCTAGRKITVITETGIVRLCEAREDILGDLRKSNYDLRKILKESKEILHTMNRNKCSCTWECAISTNIVSTPSFLPSLLGATISQFFSSRKNRS